MAQTAENYDDLLATFLSQLLERDDAQHTVFVVRSDHGLQGGPSTADYATQIEALRPWTEIIVPKISMKKSLESLFWNQERLVTGADLYRSLTAIVHGQNSESLRRISSLLFSL